MKNLSEANDVRCEVLKYEQKLNQERLKCRALEETLIKPTNVHRWRILKVNNHSARKLKLAPLKFTRYLRRRKVGKKNIRDTRPKKKIM